MTPFGGPLTWCPETFMWEQVFFLLISLGQEELLGKGTGRKWPGEEEAARLWGLIQIKFCSLIRLCGAVKAGCQCVLPEHESFFCGPGTAPCFPESCPCVERNLPPFPHPAVSHC